MISTASVVRTRHSGVLALAGVNAFSTGGAISSSPTPAPSPAAVGTIAPGSPKLDQPMRLSVLSCTPIR